MRIPFISNIKSETLLSFAIIGVIASIVLIIAGFSQRLEYQTSTFIAAIATTLISVCLGYLSQITARH